MAKIDPDCGYFNEEQDSEYAPITGECESCYRYEICLKAHYIDCAEEKITLLKPDKDSILVIDTPSELDIFDQNSLCRLSDSIRAKFPNIRIVIAPRVDRYKFNLYNKQELIDKLKDMIKRLETEEDNNE